MAGIAFLVFVTFLSDLLFFFVGLLPLFSLSPSLSLPLLSPSSSISSSLADLFFLSFADDERVIFLDDPGVFSLEVDLDLEVLFVLICFEVSFTFAFLIFTSLSEFFVKFRSLDNDEDVWITDLDGLPLFVVPGFVVFLIDSSSSAFLDLLLVDADDDALVFDFTSAFLVFLEFSSNESLDLDLILYFADLLESSLSVDFVILFFEFLSGDLAEILFFFSDLFNLISFSTSLV